jgi:putative ABC transport system permease protein
MSSPAPAPAPIISRPSPVARRHSRHWTAIWYDCVFAVNSLRLQKVRTLLTTLGIVFGVGAVIAMLAIGAGAREQSLEMIERLGLSNLLIASRPALTQQEFQQRRQVSPGLTARDVRILRANVAGIEALSPRRQLHPSKVLPKPGSHMPDLYGVLPEYATIHHFRLTEGRMFDGLDQAAASAVCVLGDGARVDLLGFGSTVGKYIKVNDTWLRVIGVVDRQFTVSSSPASPTTDLNDAIYIPLNTFKYRFWDNSFSLKDELDGVDMMLLPARDPIATAAVVTGILDSNHHGADDFTVTVPAGLLAQRRQTQRIFTYVMVAIAGISLLVGGIGIMNIVLATVLERTHEIGVRRAVGARRADIMRQFLIESALIAIAGGLIGILFGYGLSRVIAAVAQWRTLVSPAGVVLAFGVSAAVGLLFGIYPAGKAARVDPIEALRYE